MIPWLRIILYFSVFTLIIVKLKKKQVPLSPLQTAAAFGFKVLLGCLYGYVHLRFYNGDDTWLYHTESLSAWQQLQQHPLDFFRNIWPAHIQTFHDAKEFITKNLEQELMIKLLALFNLLTGGNYYLNVILFNFILFWGHYWLYSFLVHRYPEKKPVLLLSIFFIPTIVFWLSGIRGDGLVFFFLALLFVLFEKWLTGNEPRYLLFTFLAMLGIFIFRSPVLLVLIPFLAGWFITARYNRKPLPAYAIAYALCCLIFFGSAVIHPASSLPKLVADKQHEFMQLPGKTRFVMEPLQPDLKHFLKAAPSAMVNTLARPFIWEARGMLQVITAVETLLYLIIITGLLFFIEWKKMAADPWITGIIFFGLTLFLFIGLTIPFPGAIIRYKAIPELLLLVSLLIVATRIKRKKMLSIP